MLKYPLINISSEHYLKILIFLAPLFNFLSGITFDLHTPSLPAMASYFSTSAFAVKNTVPIALFGFSIGCIIFGTLLDIFGRRPTILFGLMIYTIASFLALACSNINELLFIRFIQGFSVSSAAVGCRTIIVDSFNGHQFRVALLYTSLAFGIGPIIAPFAGGFLQVHFGWKANFIAYGMTAFILTIIFALFIAESKDMTEPFSFRNLMSKYVETLKIRPFLIGIFINGLSNIQLLTYTVVGAFLVENILHRSPIVYGNSALLISCGYLLGTLANRFLIKNFLIYHLINLGFILLFIGIILEIIFAVLGKFNLFTIVFPIFIIGFSNGFLYINILTCCLKLSPNASIVTTLATTMSVIIGSIGTSIISHVDVNSLEQLVIFFGSIVTIQWLIFTFFFKKIAKETL